MHRSIFTFAPLAALVLTALSAAAQTPAAELRACVADVEQLPPEVRPGVRYLSLYALPQRRRGEMTRVVGYLLNALSRTRAISRPTAVTSTLLRFSISSYVSDSAEFQDWSRAWEKLGERDPYWHLRTEVLVSSNGAASKANGSSNGEATATTAIVTIDGGWVELAAAVRLRTLTGSGAALLRADDFVARASATPDYYRFAGIPATETEFLKSLGVDAATIEKLRANAGANLIISGVTQKPRRVVWSQGPLGGVYQTLDVAAVDARRDPIRRPLSAAGANLTYDAGEWFAMAPNGLWRVALYDSQGKLQQTVPDKIAKDTSDVAADGIVTPLVSCIRCHTEGGLRPFRDDQSRLFASGRVDLRSEDSTLVQRAAEFYDEPRLLRQMDFDRQTYAASASRATDGMQAEEIAAALGRSVREFAYQPLGTERAARELGLSAAELPQALATSHDPILLALLEGQAVLRGQWESSFADAAALAETYRARH
jgi:hypothetical protein